MLRAVLEKGKNYHDVFFSDLPFFNVENIVNLATNGGTKKPFGMVKVLFQHLRDYPNLLVSTMLQVARLAPEGFAICRREGGFVTIEFRHFDILEMCEFWEVCVANVSEPVTQIGTKIKDIHKLIAKCMDKNMFFQAKRLQNLLNVSTGSILAAMKDMGDYWKLGVIEATSILPPSMFVGDLVTLLEVRSCCTQGDVVQQLLDGHASRAHTCTRIHDQQSCALQTRFIKHPAGKCQFFSCFDKQVLVQLSQFFEKTEQT